MINKVLEVITKYNIIENGDKIVVGVSGGLIRCVFCTFCINLGKVWIWGL